MITIAFLALLGSVALGVAAGRLLVTANADRFVLVLGYGNDRRRSATGLLVVGILGVAIAATSISVHYAITSWLGPACLLGYALVFAAPIAAHNRRLTRERAHLPAAGLEVTRADAVPTVIAFAGLVGSTLFGTGVGHLLVARAETTHPMFDALLIGAGALLASGWCYVRYGRSRPYR